jgi:histidyl-tRNA synthetase
VDVFVLIEDETLRAESLRLIQELRAAGKCIEYSLTPAKGDKQFKRALELNAASTARVERSAAGEVTVRIKRLIDRQEQVVATADATNVINSLLPAPAAR